MWNLIEVVALLELPPVETDCKLLLCVVFESKTCDVLS